MMWYIIVVHYLLQCCLFTSRIGSSLLGILTKSVPASKTLTVDSSRSSIEFENTKKSRVYVFVSKSTFIEAYTFNKSYSLRFNYKTF